MTVSAASTLSVFEWHDFVNNLIKSAQWTNKTKEIIEGNTRASKIKLQRFCKEKKYLGKLSVD